MPRVLHFDITANDPDKLVEFYRKAFGWTFQKWGGQMDYWLITTGPKEEPGIDGGMGRRTEEGAKTVNTLGVPSVDEYVKRIEEACGTITVPKMAIPGVGWLAYFTDPDGNMFGIMEDDPSAK